MRALALVLALWTAPAWATQDAWPALHDVVGVAADDVLNLRAAPSATSEIVGTLAPDATGVEVIRPDDAHAWGLVNTGERTGWVALRFLARAPGQWFGATPDLAACFGTEPFWSLTFAGDPDGRGDAVTWSTPEGAQTGRVLSRPSSSSDRRRHGLVMAFDGIRTASVRTEACGDGMSDRAYGLAIDVIGADVASGCCTLQR